MFVKLPLIAEVASYAHHVFKAFDVNSTGSISFRVSICFIIVLKYISKRLVGHAGVPLHLVAWHPLREAELDIPLVRP